MTAFETFLVCFGANLLSVGILFVWSVKHMTRETMKQIQVQVDAMKEAEEKRAALAREILKARQAEAQEFGFYPISDKKRGSNS